MLWAALLLASLVALIRRLGPWRYAQLCLLAIAVAVLGNGLRAASLFYLETGFLMPLQGPVIHEIVGLAAFLFLAVALLIPAMRISGRPA
jgi:exosortase/archaeosortase family protein